MGIASSRAACVVGPPARIAGAIAATVVYYLTLPLWRLRRWHPFQGKAYQRAQHDLAARLQRGETVPIVGLTVGSHNASLCLVEASLEHGVVLVSNNEEERFSGLKHDCRFPEHSAEALQAQLRARGWSGHDVACVVSGWDVVAFGAFWAREQVCSGQLSVAVARCSRASRCGAMQCDAPLAARRWATCRTTGGCGGRPRRS
jgi:hypothetical protein